MSTKTYCIVCEDPVDIWKNELVTDAYQKDGVNHFTFMCPCGVSNTKTIPLEDVPSTMTYDSIMDAFRALIFGK